jgi:hypothetical protein
MLCVIYDLKLASAFTNGYSSVGSKHVGWSVLTLSILEV